MDRKYLGIEFGSTRIKAVAIDDRFRVVDTGDFTWKSKLENGVWTYDMADVWHGLKTALKNLDSREGVSSAGVSAMMHGYLPFDKDWNLLVPFRTWQNTMTAVAAEELSSLFGFNIPQRWSIAHLYQAVLNREPHVDKIAHITTLAGYVHFMLTGENAVGIGEGSGIFPVDGTMEYDKVMLDKFDHLISVYGLPWKIRDVLPEIRMAGDGCGKLTKQGARLLEGLLPEGLPFCPPEGDAGTGMVASNAVAPRTGNVSAGTSIFSMVVLERPLRKVYPEVGVVTTPAGRPVAMVHCSNCTADMNAWVGLFRELLREFGAEPSVDTLYTTLYNKSMEGQPDAGGTLVYNYISGESVTHTDRGVPVVLRKPDRPLLLANFLRAQLYTAVATLSMGKDLMAEENVKIDSLIGHGGYFKTPGIGQKYLASAFGVPVTCMEAAGEGGPYGMALLASFMLRKAPGQSLEQYLREQVFANVKAVTVQPDPQCAEGFRQYMQTFRACLQVEKTAVENI